MVDTAADISIMNGELFREVAAANRLKKKAFRDADKVPYTFDQRKFKLDGCIDLDISFDGQTMCTPVYVKADARDPILLSEGVCRQLGIVSYHPLVGTNRKDAKQEKQPDVPMVRVKLVQSVRILPRQSVLVPVHLEQGGGCVLLEGSGQLGSVDFASSLVDIPKGSTAQVMLTNSSGFTQKLEGGEWIGQATEVKMICHDSREDGTPVSVETAPEAGDSEATPAEAMSERELLTGEEKEGSACQDVDRGWTDAAMAAERQATYVIAGQPRGVCCRGWGAR